MAERIQFEDEDEQIDWKSMTPGERIDAVWGLTVKEWRRRDPEFRESRLRKDIVVVIRPEKR